jgi:hypothetical protein
MHAIILMARYQYAIAAGIPVKFGKIVRISDFPALLSPEVDWSAAVPNLPQVNPEVLQAIFEGRSFLWLKTIFNFRDDLANQYEMRFTGRYGRVAGKDRLGFAFIDAEIPKENWGVHNFMDARCMNIINPIGCRD